MDRLKDPEYIDILSREGGWIIVTTDVAMSRSPHLVQALASSGLISVSLRHGWLELGGREMASRLLKRWSEIRESVEGSSIHGCICSDSRENPAYQPAF